jgi:ATP-dependent DNA helicase PIF1
MTIHAFAGVGIGEGSVESIIKKMRFNRVARERIKAARVMVIDEISMLSAAFFDMLEREIRAVHENWSKPIGGLQLVLCGDFLQLPPVMRRRSSGGVVDASRVFCFQSDCWSECVNETILLSRVFRQTNAAMITMLNEVRRGRISKITEELLLSCVDCKLDTSDGIVPTKLYSLKSHVDRENQTQMARFDGERRVFAAVDKGSRKWVDFLDRNAPAPKQLGLVEGAQVMLLKNLDLDNGVCNGSRGVVVGFTSDPDKRCDPVDAAKRRRNQAK